MRNPRLLVLWLTLLIPGSVSASAESNKVTLCHVTGSGNVNALSVSESAVPAHLQHGDFSPINFYADADGDGLGDPATTVLACTAPEGYVDNSDDCDDTVDPSPPDVAIACGGGHEASINNYPYQVSIQRLVAGAYIHQCGGAYLGGNKILTAASCVSKGCAGDYRVVLGSSNLSTITTEILVTDRAIHPNYTGTDAGLEFNVAVLTLQSTPPNGPTILPITKAAPTAGNFAGVSSPLTGWGDTANTPQRVNDGLQQQTVTVLTNADCSTRLSFSGRPITSSHICALATALDACTGDVGGPLRAGSTLIGIQSWPVDLTVPYSSASSVPRVFTRISTVSAWIQSQL